jgi:hypothetical protein
VTAPATTTTTPKVAPGLTGQETARAFWTKMVEGTADAIAPFYAETVTLAAGSELLKPQWGIASGQRDQDQDIPSQKLLEGYRRMMDQAGREKWRAAFSQVPREDVVTEVAEQDGLPLSCVRKGDVVLRVIPPKDRDNVLTYVFRLVDGSWKVVGERTDY